MINNLIFYCKKNHVKYDISYSSKMYGCLDFPMREEKFTHIDTIATSVS